MSETEVDVWYSAVGDVTMTPGVSDVLSAEERQRADGYIRPESRRRFIDGRLFLRNVLAGYLEVDPQSLAFRRERRGKLELSQPTDSGLHFNVSHSSHLIALAVSRDAAVGIDVELVRNVSRIDALLRRWLPPEDFERLKACAPAFRDRERIQMWTRVEAVAKAAGIGLWSSSSSLARLIEGMAWSRLNPAPGYVGTLATANGAPTVTVRSLGAPTHESAH